MSRLAATLAFTLAIAPGMADSARAESSPSAPRHPIHIAPQDLSSALQAFGRLQGLRIMFVSEDVENLKSGGIQGMLTDDEALQALTRGTGLSFKFLDPRTVSILPLIAPAPSANPTPDAAPKRMPAAASRPEAAATLDELTVTSGRYPAGEALKLRSTRYVSLHSGGGAPSSRLARWYRPICPMTTGLSTALNAFVSTRIEEIARSVGAPVKAAGGCDPANVEIMFTTQPQKLMDEVANRFQGVLGFPYVSQIRRKAAVTDAVQSWYATATRKRFGDGGLGSANAWTVDRASNPDPNLVTGTHLPPTVETALTNVLIVIDTGKIGNRKLSSLADYVAMLVLSQAKSTDKCDELPTIFDLLSSECASQPVSEAITAGDAAYLKGLYAADPGHTASTAMADVAERMYLEIEAEQSALLQR
jgi:hypothetical protein